LFFVERILMEFVIGGANEIVADNVDNQIVRMRGETKRELISSNYSR